MDRGLRAQLRPNKETALRKVAAGANPSGIPLDQLSALWLIESRDGKWELTDFGKLRIAPEHWRRELQAPN